MCRYAKAAIWHEMVSERMSEKHQWNFGGMGRPPFGIRVLARAEFTMYHQQQRLGFKVLSMRYTTLSTASNY